MREKNMNLTSVGLAVLTALSLVGCSMVTDVDRSEIPDDLFKPLDASTPLDAGLEPEDDLDAAAPDAGADAGDAG